MKQRLKKIVKKLFPLEIVHLGRRLLLRKKYYCPVCKRKVFEFIPYTNLENYFIHRVKHNIFQSETFNLLKYFCPKCNASDRERFYALYLSEYLQNKSLCILDIAPSKSLSKFLKTVKNCNYRTADLYMPNVDDRVDITNMDIYSDERFDFIICSHVLEHIENDIQAMSEIHRVLAKDGKAIVMVPINLDLENDYELKKPMTEAERWHHYGQNFHVRQYSKNGFVSKLKSVGFAVEEITVKNYSNELFNKCGIYEKSVLYIVSKN